MSSAGVLLLKVIYLKGVTDGEGLLHKWSNEACKEAQSLEPHLELNVSAGAKACRLSCAAVSVLSGNWSTSATAATAISADTRSG